MFRTKEGVRRSLSRTLRVLAPGLCIASLGCTDTGGLRSVWPDRPTLLGFWDRKPQPPPDPADDNYARYMHAARERSDPLARRSRDDADTAGPSRDDDESRPPGPSDTRLADESPAPSRSRTSGRNVTPAERPARDETIQVTLGTPEPLPSASNRAGATLASTSAPNRPSARPSLSSPSIKDARAILDRSEAKVQSLGTYQVKMARVERVNGRLQPEEEVVLSIHRQPKEVRLQWASGPSEGREVIYSTRVDDRSLFVHMPKSAIPLNKIKMAIDSPMVTRSSRHSITEAGFDTIISNLRKSVNQADAANAAQGRAAYRGVEKPPGLDRPSHVFTRRSPNGETWTVFIDARTMLPSMVVAKDPSGQLDEKYIYHEVIENPADLAAADAFDPDRRWGAPKGFLSRLAGGGANAKSPGNGQSTMR